MTNIELMKYWIENSDRDYDVMISLYTCKKNNYALFFGQMVIEKLLKAIYAKLNKTTPYAPKSHDLIYLAEKCELKLDDYSKRCLANISRFNIEARYDDYKESFYKMCTDEYTKTWIKNIEEVRKWLKSQLN